MAAGGVIGPAGAASGRRRTRMWVTLAVGVFIAQHLMLRRQLSADGGGGMGVVQAPLALTAAQAQLLQPSADDRLTVVVFFASWCIPCRIELPQLQKCWQQHQHHGLRLLGIYDEASADDIEPFVAQLGLTFVTQQDHEQQWAQAFAVTGLPSVVVVDRRQQVVYRSRGYDPRLLGWLQQQLGAEGGR